MLESQKSHSKYPKSDLKQRPKTAFSKLKNKTETEENMLEKIIKNLSK